MLLPPVAGCAAAEASPPPTIPTVGQALQRRQPHTTAEPVNPRTPLRVGIHCRVFPGSASSPSYASPSSTAVVLSAQRGQCGQRPTSIGITVGGEADSWVHGSCKEVPPYYAENNYSST